LAGGNTADGQVSRCIQSGVDSGVASDAERTSRDEDVTFTGGYFAHGL